MNSRPSKRVRKGASFDLARTVGELRRRQGTREELESLSETEWRVAVDMIAAIGANPPESARRYVGASQNDAQIIDFRIQRDSVELVLNHYDVWRLATAAGLGYARTMRSFPVTFRFADPTRVSVQHLHGHGDFQAIRASVRSLGRRLLDIVTIEIGQHAEGVEAVIVAHGRRARDLKEGWGTSMYFIHVLARTLEVEERYREGWLRLSGGDDSSLLDRFDSVWPVQHWSTEEFRHFVNGKT